jgi:hypothetical protein
MDFNSTNDISLSIDMDDLGVRPLDWINLNKNLDYPINDLFGSEKTVDFTVYSAELQLVNSEQKLTTNDDETLLSDDDDNNNDYDIDPETGEKIFRETTFVSNISLASSSPSPPNDKWIEEYLSNIESSSNQALPTTTTTFDSPFVFENISLSSLENLNTQADSDWFSNLLDLDENSDMFTDSMMSNSEYFDENKSNQTTTTTTTTLSVSIDDEYSTSNSNDSNRQHQSYPSIENNSDITIIETKLEKIEHDETAPLSQMMIRRSSTRMSFQGQQDEDALRQYNIPLTLNDITQSSTEEYNRHLTRLSHLTAEQIHIIKDIRRRGKNKIAAQNCRKRKAISVESLLEEVDELKRVKHELEERKRAYQQQITETRNQYEYLHRQVLPDRQLPPAIIVK